MRQNFSLFAFIVLCVLFHLFGALIGGTFSNISPFIALFFCGAAYAQRSKAFLVIAFTSFLLVTFSSSMIHGYSPWIMATLVNILAYVVIALVGSQFQQKKPIFILFGSMSGAVFFHLFTNLICFFTSPLYAKNGTGLAQALWTTPPFEGALPTAVFFRNTCASTFLFTILFLIAAHYPTFRAKQALDVKPIHV